MRSHSLAVASAVPCCGVGKREPLCGELDGEAREVVFRVSEEAEGTAVGNEDVANEQETYALTLWLGGEERREELSGDLGRNAASIVCDSQFTGRYGDGDFSLSNMRLLDVPCHQTDCQNNRCSPFLWTQYGFSVHCFDGLHRKRPSRSLFVR